MNRLNFATGERVTRITTLREERTTTGVFKTSRGKFIVKVLKNKKLISLGQHDKKKDALKEYSLFTLNKV